MLAINSHVVFTCCLCMLLGNKLTCCRYMLFPRLRLPSRSQRWTQSIQIAICKVFKSADPLG